MTPGGLEPSSPEFHSMDPLTHTIKITGSWEEKWRSSIALPDIVWKFLKLHSAAKDTTMQKLIETAVIEYYNLKKPAS